MTPPHPNLPAEPTPPAKHRRLRVLVLRLGILGVFVAALGVAVTGFALFGCACDRNNVNSSKYDGMTVNPPDPSTNAPEYLLKR
jgi:hypothetical protein